MIRVLLVWLLLASPCLAKHPYDSVCWVSTGGSGTLVYSKVNKGLILTNAHVVSSTGEVTVKWPLVTSRLWRAKTVYVNFEDDLALLLCSRPPVKPIPYRASASMMIVSTGFPHYDRNNLHWQVSSIRTSEGDTLWVYCRPVPGMSGGAAFDYSGYLAGVVTWTDKKKGGGLIHHEALANILAKYQDSKTWIIDDSHIQERHNFDLAPKDNKRRTIRYNTNTAPDLR